MEKSWNSFHYEEFILPRMGLTLPFFGIKLGATNIFGIHVFIVILFYKKGVFRILPT